MTHTTTGTIQSVQAVTLGSTLAADASIGDGVITVDDSTDFDSEAGGTLAVGGATYVYSAVDDDTGVITLGGTLGANASNGDRVDVWNVAQDVASVEYRALVKLPGDVDNTEVMDVPIDLPLVPLLPEGLREEGEGEAVTLERRDDEWVVTDAPGLAPQIQSAAFPVAITNWNAATTPGEYLSIEGFSTNSPDDTFSWAGTVIGRGAPGSLPQIGNAIVQVLHHVDAAATLWVGSPETWIRRQEGDGSWLPWWRVTGPVTAAEWTDCVNAHGYTKDATYPVQVYLDINGRTWIEGRMNKTSPPFPAGSFADTMSLPSALYAPVRTVHWPIASGNGDICGVAFIVAGDTTIQIAAAAGSSVGSFFIIGNWQAAT